MILPDGTTHAGRTPAHWRRVALIVARMTGKRVGLDTATRMAADADLSPNQESGDPRAHVPSSLTRPNMIEVWANVIAMAIAAVLNRAGPLASRRSLVRPERDQERTGPNHLLKKPCPKESPHGEKGGDHKAESGNH